jgi:hypothetical protein
VGSKTGVPLEGLDAERGLAKCRSPGFGSVTPARSPELHLMPRVRQTAKLVHLIRNQPKMASSHLGHFYITLSAPQDHDSTGHLTLFWGCRKEFPKAMSDSEMAANRILDLYWLGYLLTGDREQSVHGVLETLEMPDAANPFFESWFSTWARKIFIAKVLGYVSPRASASELRIRLRRLEAETGPIRPIDPTAGKAELERALLNMDPFPRCALLLSVFEKLAVEDVGILLNTDRESVKTATAIGLIELARNLAGDRSSEPAGRVRATSLEAMQEMAA